MNPDFLPPLAGSLRALGAFAARHEVTDATLVEIAAELDRARVLVASARGAHRANRCARHPGGPVDPTADNGCLLCGTSRRRPARPMPDGVTPGEVLRFAEEHGHQAAEERFGGRALARAVAAGRGQPVNVRVGIPAQPDSHDDVEGEL
ncbi:hypothetical protein ABZ543_08360 [Streptomyces roseifaciens]